MLSGRSLEPFGNGRPRQMITQRHNPAYRSACAFKNRIVSYNVIFNLRRFSSAGFSQVFLCDRKLRRNSLLQKKWKLYSASTIKYQYCYKNNKNIAFIQSLFLSSESAYGYKPDADTWHPVRGAGHERQWHPQSHGGSLWSHPAVYLWWSLQTEESSC